MNNSFITSYKEIEQLKPKTARVMLRNIALSGLSMLPGEAAFKKPRVQFIYIHHIFKDEEAAFRQLLARLQKDHTFISYTDAVNRILSGTIDKPYITFSSDDGFLNNVKAAEILNEFGASCCFFINPGIVGEKDVLKIKKYCTEQLQYFAVEFMDWKQINALQKQGHEIGNHTMFHINVAATLPDKLREDLAQSLQVLRKECSEVNHFAFPFGRFSHFSKVGRQLVFEAGHASCATAERGCHINPDKPITAEELCIRRDHTVLGWDMNHIMYFLARSAKQATTANNYYPASFQ